MRSSESAMPETILPGNAPGNRLTLFHRDHYFCATVEDRTYLTVKPVWAAPLSRPGAYLALLDEAGEEIALLPDVAVLAASSRAALQEELRRRYLTATI